MINMRPAAFKAAGRLSIRKKGGKSEDKLI